MNFLTATLSLGLVLSTLIPANKRDCNAINELAYTFRYVVESPGVGVVSQHWEERLSDLVHGSYSFLEPTGKIRLVEYQVSGKHGFRAAVTFRKPPGIPLVGHLQYPDYYRAPIVFAKPVGLITRDLFRARKTYPNLTV